jgi:dolichol-phosphate mannosyltransferase
MEAVNKELSVVIPAYLESENLRVLLPRLMDSLGTMGLRSEVIVVDTMEPKDETSAVCEQFAVRYLNRKNGNDYGDAIRTGIEYAEGSYTIFIDADGSHTPEFVKTLYDNRSAGDVVIASRYVDGGNTDNGKLLIFMSLIVNVIYSFVLGLHCKDVSNSFKLYKTDDLKSLSLKCNNFDIVEEILFRLKQNKGKGLRIKEIPFAFKKRMFGETKRNLFFFMMSYVATLFKLRFL